MLTCDRLQALACEWSDPLQEIRHDLPVTGQGRATRWRPGNVTVVPKFRPASRVFNEGSHSSIHVESLIACHLSLLKMQACLSQKPNLLFNIVLFPRNQ
jgi:hypothetical protein